MEVRVNDYLILEAETRKELVAKVRSKLEEGWEPQGGYVKFKDGYGQAIIYRQG